MWPVQVLQRAAAAFYLHTADPERADKLDPLLMLDKALEGVWPGYTGGCEGVVLHVWCIVLALGGVWRCFGLLLARVG